MHWAGEAEFVAEIHSFCRMTTAAAIPTSTAKVLCKCPLGDSPLFWNEKFGWGPRERASLFWKRTPAVHPEDSAVALRAHLLRQPVSGLLDPWTTILTGLAFVHIAALAAAAAARAGNAAAYSAALSVLNKVIDNSVVSSIAADIAGAGDLRDPTFAKGGLARIAQAAVRVIRVRSNDPHFPTESLVGTLSDLQCVAAEHAPFAAHLSDMLRGELIQRSRAS